MSAVLAAGTWPTNAHLIEDAARLGYLRPEWLTLDPTYGRGVWWRRFRPDEGNLIGHDLNPAKAPDLVANFLRLPYADDTFQAAVFDPTYVCAGGRTTTSISDMHHRFGMDTAPTTTRGVQDNINGGLSELARVVRPGGYILAKCQDYISSGALWPGTYLTMGHALGIGLRVKDRFEHITSKRPQPQNNPDGTVRVQQHARRNLSTLFVFQVPTRRSVHQRDRFLPS